MKRHKRYLPKYKKEHHDRIHRRDAIRAAVAAGIILVLMAVVALLICRWENQTYAARGGTEEVSFTEEGERPDIVYNGETYTPKQQVESYLFMGIDVEGPVVSVPGNFNGGQADAQFLIVIDNENETWQLLRLNRDSIVSVPVLDLKGNVIGYEQQQLALAHAYGDGTYVSCENTVRTVSALLGDQPINGYASLNMDGISVFNDAIGGVTVTITSDFTAVDPTLVEGETITLNGQQAFEFVRTRKDVDDQSNLARMERQRVYLEATKSQLMTLADEDIIRIYDDMSDYVVTDMGSKNFLDLAEKLKSYQEKPELTIDGINQIENEHVAYMLDEDSLQKVVLELFYQKENS